MARISHFSQITADGLKGHFETLRQILYDHAALGARDFQNFVLPETQGQGAIPFRSLARRELSDKATNRSSRKFASPGFACFAALRREILRFR
jgi:hypothetical protein